MKLIDKDKVREWLEAKKKREGWCAVGADVADVYYARGVRLTCDTCKDFLDTLEVKEANSTDTFIEKATSYIQQHWIWNTKMIEDFKNYIKGE